LCIKICLIEEYILRQFVKADITSQCGFYACKHFIHKFNFYSIFGLCWKKPFTKLLHVIETSKYKLFFGKIGNVFIMNIKQPPTLPPPQYLTIKTLPPQRNSMTCS
jgi:hypothetical protein